MGDCNDHSSEITGVRIMPTGDATTFHYQPAEGGGVTLQLAGRLNATSLPSIWNSILAPIQKNPPSAITVDLSKVESFDGAGIGLLVEIDRQVRGRGGTVQFEHLNPEQAGVLNVARLHDPAKTFTPPPPREGSIAQVGRATADILNQMRSIVTFTGELTVVLFWALTHPHRVRWRDMLQASEKTGANAVPVVALLGFLVGLIIAFQCAGPLSNFGAESFVPTVVAISIVSELGPLMAAIILAGRSGSAFAAEIGTMKVTEEINALITFGLSPTKFLVLPRVLASLLVTPMLGVISSVMGVVGGYVVMAALGYSLSFYVEQIQSAVNYVDFLQGVLKSFVFAILVAAIGCLSGLRTNEGPGAVGDSTTKAVVAGIVLIVLADAILGSVFYYVRL